jgi:hypothetical protein
MPLTLAMTWYSRLKWSATEQYRGWRNVKWQPAEEPSKSTGSLRVNSRSFGQQSNLQYWHTDRITLQLHHQRYGQDLRAPGGQGSQDFGDNRHTKVVRWSALLTGRLYPQEISRVLISVRGWIHPRVLVDYINEKSNDSTGNRTYDLPACSTRSPLPMTQGRPGQVNNLASLPTDVLWSSRDWAGEPLQCRVPKVRILFGDITTHVQTWVHRHRISDYSSAVLAPLIGWLTDQLLGWPDLTNSTCCTHLMLLGLIPSNIW